jgi:hypothetical protein
LQVSPDVPRRIVHALLLAATLFAARTARADEPVGAVTHRQLTATISSGSLLPEDHVYKLGLVGYSLPPTLYFGLSFEGDLTRRLRLEGSLGLEVSLGFVAETSLRFVAFSSSGFSLGLGGGPMLAFGSTFGTAVFGAANAEARYVYPGTPFVGALSVGLAYALNDAGTAWCGIDTCTAYIRVGDRLVNALASLGFVFDL